MIWLVVGLVFGLVIGFNIGIAAVVMRMHGDIRMKAAFDDYQKRTDKRINKK